VGQEAPTYTAVPAIDNDWIENEWRNLCLGVFNRSLFFKYVLAKFVEIINTEGVIETCTSMYEKIPYDKSALIPNYNESQDRYLESDVNLGIDLLYRNVRNHIERGRLINLERPIVQAISTLPSGQQ
jgi:hypothetical protein